MLTWALILFAVAATGGVAMVIIRARDEMPSLGLAALHGLLAAVALVLLVLGVLAEPVGTAVILSLVIFVLAALGGFLLLASHLRRDAFPLGGALAHGGAAVLAFLILLAALYF